MASFPHIWNVRICKYVAVSSYASFDSGNRNDGSGFCVAKACLHLTSHANAVSAAKKENRSSHKNTACHGDPNERRSSKSSRAISVCTRLGIGTLDKRRRSSRVALVSVVKVVVFLSVPFIVKDDMFALMGVLFQPFTVRTIIRLWAFTSRMPETNIMSY
jgi:hypothetical protein